MNYMKRAAEMFYALSGWKIDGVIPPEIKRCVLILAPHTSNTDLLYARMMFFLDKRPAYFLIKSDYMRSPFKVIFKSIGAIGVERKQSTDMVERLSDLINAQEEIILGIAPEGTRGFSKRWKTGFYQIALEARVPIALLYLDYRRKAVG
ncbi:MAG: 1-acyl-sn-glycerol-3-phosphate acyltransferase, partial [Ignavibacteriales bacterium]